MTKTAMANRDRQSRERIAYADRVNKSEIARQERNLKREEGAKDRAAQIASAGINATGRLLGGLSKGGGAAAGGVVGRLIKVNDPAWYKNYIKDLNEFVSVPTFDRLGAQKFFHDYIQVGTTNYTVPGIMIFEYLPTCGPQENGGSHFRNAVNQTLARAKEKVLALNSRSSVNWEFADLGLNLFCSASLVAILMDLRRAILVYQTYNAKNAYLARALLEALGWDWNDFVTHYAEYRKLYVMLAARFNTTIVAPKSMSLYDRKIFLNSNVFVDTDETGYIRQMYAYKYIRHFQLSDTGDSALDLSITRGTFNTYYAEVLLCFDRIASNPDFLEMYQDLRHAFGDDLVQLPESVAGETIEFNDVALNREQIHNLMVAPIGFDINGTYKPCSIADVNWRLRQDSNGYLYQGGTNDARDRKIHWASIVAGASATAKTAITSELLNYYGTNYMQLVNMHKEHVTGDDILDITRNMFSCSIAVPTGDDVDMTVTGCGTEVILFHKILAYRADSDTLMSRNASTFVLGNATDYTEVSSVVLIYSLASTFDWAPIMRLSEFDYAGGSVYSKFTFCDAHTTFELNRNSIYKIHEAAVMSELYITDSNFRG